MGVQGKEVSECETTKGRMYVRKALTGKEK
jgi:hypothetical protein